ncbi:Uma2 family endonuclease [Streptomyces sp. BH055]|uniref:Uma2 family endonuclease n=1 Tax=unclassified Streptomyces TaxID=2593676 RepID=UPI003BB5C5B9
MGALMMSTAADNEPQPPQPQSAWPTPPLGGWTADDLDTIPGLPPHAEMIDGGLFLVSPQTVFHMTTLRLLENALVSQAPTELFVVREMTTKLDRRNRPEPDLMVVPDSAVSAPRQTWFDPEDVRLAVEIVSDDSVERDREVKPRKYAAARIRHFWRVEENDGKPVVYVYELDPSTRTYAVTGIHHDRLKLSVPFDLDIDLAPRRRGGRADTEPGGTTAN